jgi:hypothetical protein
VADEGRPVNWQHGEFESTAELGKDGSGYHVLQLQKGLRIIAWWAWPKERHYTSNRQRHCLDDLYDGGSKDAAIEACEDHRAAATAKAAEKSAAKMSEYFDDDYVPTTEDFQHVE